MHFSNKDNIQPHDRLSYQFLYPRPLIHALSFSSNPT
jgi:hypothetical protein